MTDEAQIDGTTFAEKDANKNIAVLPDRVLNSIGEKDIHASFDGLVVPIAQGLGMTDAINPANTTTPVADAASKIVNASGSGGAILLPPENVQEESSYTSQIEDISIIGWGTDASSVEFTDLSADGFVISPAAAVARVFWDGFTISGSDRANRTGGSALHFETNSARQFNVGTIAFKEWIDPVVHFDSANPFGSRWRQLFFKPGTYDGNAIQIDTLGPGVHIDSIYCASNNAATEIDYSSVANGDLQIGSITVDSGGGQALDALVGANGTLRVGTISYEGGQTLTNVANLGEVGFTQLGVVKLQSGTVDRIVDLSSNNANNWIGELQNNGTVNDNLGNVRNTPSGQSYYFGDGGSSDWGPSFRTDDAPLCFADLKTGVPAASNTVTLSGGAGTGRSNAASLTLNDVSSSETDDIGVQAVLNSDPGISTDYAWEWAYYTKWDNANSHVDVVAEVWWKTDPGSNNDITVLFEASRNNVGR